MEKTKLLLKRIEHAGNGISATMFTTAGLLIIKDGAPVFTYATEASVLALTGVAVYLATTWWLYELTPETTGNSTNTDSDNEDG